MVSIINYHYKTIIITTSIITLSWHHLATWLKPKRPNFWNKWKKNSHSSCSGMLAMPRTQDGLPLSPPGSSRLAFWSLGLAAKVRSTDKARIGSTPSYSFQIWQSSSSHPIILNQSRRSDWGNHRRSLFYFLEGLQFKDVPSNLQRLGNRCASAILVCLLVVCHWVGWG